MYLSISAIRQDPFIRDRVSACIAVEGIQTPPDQWAFEHSWELAAQPGWAAAWDSALAGHPGDLAYQPGADEAVITDGMILAAVQLLNG